MGKLKIEYIGVDKLVPYINNPRKNDRAIDIVAASIQEFGFKNPILIDKDNVIIAGHTRLLASQKLGLSEIPVIKAEDLTDSQIKAFRIADNKTNEFSEWDVEKLLVELEDIDGLFTGFSENDIDNLLSELEPIDLDEDEPAQDEEDGITCYCPKCGFEFEVKT